jgi:hypothetical protein
MQSQKTLISALKNGVRSLSPNCREASRLQSEPLSRSLSMSQRWGLRVHLLLCKWCRRYARQIRFLRGALREEANETSEAAPKTLSPGTRERMKQSLRGNPSPSVDLLCKDFPSSSTNR